MMATVHLGIVTADPQVHETCADRSFLGLEQDTWHEVVCAHDDR